MRHRKRRHNQQAELEITPFMNLMIVLVPVLLLNMVFTHISVLDLQLPKLDDEAIDFSENKTVELIIEESQLSLYYPADNPLFHTRRSEEKPYDYEALQKQLRALKTSFQEHSIEKTDILLRIDQEIPYQTIVTTMDNVRSYKAVVAGSLVDAELFPDISLGDLSSRKSDLAAVNTQ